MRQVTCTEISGLISGGCSGNPITALTLFECFGCNACKKEYTYCYECSCRQSHLIGIAANVYRISSRPFRYRISVVSQADQKREGQPSVQYLAEYLSMQIR